MEELIIVILKRPGACWARKSASTRLRSSFRLTFSLAATSWNRVSSGSGSGSPSRCHPVPVGCSTGTTPPTVSSSSDIQFARRTSPSVKTSMPASR
jgi:hypothetical protein